MSNRLNQSPSPSPLLISGGDRAGSASPFGFSTSTSPARSRSATLDGVAALDEVTSVTGATVLSPPSSVAPLNASTLLDDFKQDALMRPFLSDTFDVHRQAGTLVASARKLKSGIDANATTTSENVMTLAEMSSKLQKAIERVDGELNANVAANHENLLMQVSNIKELEKTMEVVRVGVDTLNQSIQRIRDDIAEPFATIRTRTQQLERIHDTTELLRRVLRFLYQTRKLRHHLQRSTTTELPKAAACFKQIDDVRHEIDLSGISLVDNELDWVVKAGEDITARASHLLVQGMETQNQSETANALQAFHNLGNLQERVELAIAHLNEKVAQTVLNAFDVQSIGQASAVARDAGHKNSLHYVLWRRVEQLFDTMHATCIQIFHLERVLALRIDPHTHRPLLAFVTDDSSQDGHELRDTPLSSGGARLSYAFWCDACALVSERLKRVANESPPVRKALVHAYPRLLRLAFELLRRLQTHYDLKQSTGDEALLSEETERAEQRALLDAIKTFEDPFIDSISKRLTGVADTILQDLPVVTADVAGAATAAGLSLTGSSSALSGSESAVASDEALGTAMERVGALAKAVGTELDASSVSVSLGIRVGTEAQRTLRHFAEQLLRRVHVHTDAYQVLDPITGVQISNGRLFGLLWSLLLGVQQSVAGVRARVDRRALAVLDDAYVTLVRVAHRMVAPLFARIRKTVEQVIVLMHKQQEYGVEADSDIGIARTQCSPFVQLLQRRIAHFRGAILSRHCDSFVLDEHCLALARHVLVEFVRHASLVRPLSGSGARKLAADMAQLEMAISPLVASVKEVGVAYKELRDFRKLLAMPLDELGVLSGANVMVSLPPMIVIHHVLCRAPPRLRSPHIELGMSPKRYWTHLDEMESDAQRWSVVRKAALGGAASASKTTKEADNVDRVFRDLFLRVGDTLCGSVGVGEERKSEESREGKEGKEDEEGGAVTTPKSD